MLEAERSCTYLVSITFRISNTTSSSRLQEKANVQDQRIYKQQQHAVEGPTCAATAASSPFLAGAGAFV
jgi:hypothetical protein